MTYTKNTWSKNIGPSTGMSARIGIRHDGTRAGALRSWASERTRLARNDVMPRARMLMTTPAMIWSTLNRMASHTRRRPSSAPTTIAPITPAHVP